MPYPVGTILVGDGRIRKSNLTTPRAYKGMFPLLNTKSNNMRLCFRYTKIAFPRAVALYGSPILMGCCLLCISSSNRLIPSVPPPADQANCICLHGGTPRVCTRPNFCIGSSLWL
jgi:hypothetical protein